MTMNRRRNPEGIEFENKVAEAFATLKSVQRELERGVEIPVNENEENNIWACLHTLRRIHHRITLSRF